MESKILAEIGVDPAIILIVMFILIVVLFFMLQKYYVSGVTGGAVKG